MSGVHKLIFVAGFIAFFLMAVRSIAATVHLASESYVNRKIGMRQAYGRVRRRNLGVVWLRFILFFFVPALFLAPVITFIVGPGIPVAVLEDLNLKSGPVSRGWSLSQGKKGRVALLFLLSWMASAIVFAGWRVVVNLELLPFYPAGNMA